MNGRLRCQNHSYYFFVEKYILSLFPRIDLARGNELINNPIHENKIGRWLILKSSHFTVFEVNEKVRRKLNNISLECNLYRTIVLAIVIAIKIQALM